MATALDTVIERPLTQRPAWQELDSHSKEASKQHLRSLFADDPERGKRMTAEGAGIYLDYSKNRITEETQQLLLKLAEECGLRGRIDAMFRGDKINITENRSVLHVALRMPKGSSLIVDGQDVVGPVHAVLDKMASLSDRVRSGAWTGHTGKRIKNVINIGIGGSDLGPVMAYEALKHYSQRDLTFRFVSNVDGTDFADDQLKHGDLLLKQRQQPILQRSARHEVEYKYLPMLTDTVDTANSLFDSHRVPGKFVVDHAVAKLVIETLTAHFREQQHVHSIGVGFLPLKSSPQSGPFVVSNPAVHQADANACLSQAFEDVSQRVPERAEDHHPMVARLVLLLPDYRHRGFQLGIS